MPWLSYLTRATLCGLHSPGQCRHCQWKASVWCKVARLLFASPPTSGRHGPRSTTSDSLSMQNFQNRTTCGSESSTMASANPLSALHRPSFSHALTFFGLDPEPAPSSLSTHPSPSPTACALCVGYIDQVTALSRHVPSSRASTKLGFTLSDLKHHSIRRHHWRWLHINPSSAP